MKAKKSAIKRMMAICLTAVMTLAMATTAFAKEAEATPMRVPEKGNLTVHVNDRNTLENQTINVYKLFELSVNAGHYAYTVNETFKEPIATALGLPATATSEDLYNKLKTYHANGSEIQKFADDFTAAALGKKLNATKTSGKITVKETKEYKFTDVDYGYYLVYQTGTKEIQSSLVSVDKPEATVNLKGEAPKITKKADEKADTVQIGQVVTYTVTGTIPDTTGYERYTYKIHDTLTDGLDFVTDQTGNTAATTPLNVDVQIGEEKVQKPADLSGINNRTMTLNLSDWIRSKQDKKGQEFTVTYYAKVNKDAVVQTNNKASLEYGNDPDNTTLTTPVVVTTPTYPLDINKTDDIVEKPTRLPDAIFRLYKNELDAKAGNDNALKVEGTNGSYTVAVNQNAPDGNMDMRTIADEVGAGYNLRLNGLAAGDYWLVEKEAPAGYNKLTAPIKVTIAKTGELTWTVSKDSVEENDKIIDVKNSTGTILPETGGMGTVLFTVVAVILIIGVVISFIRSRRKEA